MRWYEECGLFSSQTCNLHQDSQTRRAFARRAREFRCGSLLKAVLQSELDRPRKSGSGDLAIRAPESGRRPPVTVVWTGNDVGQVDPVEQIEELRTELDVISFGYVEGLLNREIDCRVSRRSQGVATPVPEMARIVLRIARSADWDVPRKRICDRSYAGGDTGAERREPLRGVEVIKCTAVHLVGVPARNQVRPDLLGALADRVSLNRGRRIEYRKRMAFRRHAGRTAGRGSAAEGRIH